MYIYPSFLSSFCIGINASIGSDLLNENFLI